MKKILLSFLFMGLYFGINAQIIPPENEVKLTDKELGLKYLKKSRDFKIAGWSLLAAGIITNIIGVNQQTKDLFDAGGETISLIGSIITIGSIPCFIAGAKNKGRAEILLRNENILLSNIYRRSKFYPSFTIAFKL